MTMTDHPARQQATTGRRWYEGPNRLLLINLRVGDEARFKPASLIEMALAYRATAFSINGGGIVAFYQSTVPGHPISPGLQGRDLLREIIPLARAAGIRIMTRIDPSCADRAHFDAHPEWFARDIEGRAYEVSDHFVTCPNSGYYYEFMPLIVEELLARYDVDGLWNNHGKFQAWDTGICYCERCRTLFRAEAGAEIPRVADSANAVWRAFSEWRYRRIAQWVKHIWEVKQRVKPQAVWTAAIQVMEPYEFIRSGGWDVDYWIEHQDVLTLECQRRSWVPWWPGAQAKYLRTIARGKPTWMTVSYFYPWWRLYAAPEAENRFWIAQQAANGTSPWLHINGAESELFDRRGFAPTQAVFQRLSAWDEYLDGAQSAAQVALVYSRQSLDHGGADAPERNYLDHFRGYYRALLEQHIPFDVLSDKLLDDAALRGYAVVVLPNTVCLSDEAAAALERFASAGRTVVASYRTGFRTPDGALRAEPALAALMGGAQGYAGEETRSLVSSYARIASNADPLAAGIGDTDLIPNEGPLVQVRVLSGWTVPFTLIPPIQASSGSNISIPEYSRIIRTTDQPIVAYGSHGAGRMIYIANTMDALFYRYGFSDLGLVLANAVRLGLGEALNLEVEAPEFVDISFMRQPQRYLLHLINFPVDKPLSTGVRNVGRRIVPVTSITVRLRLAPGEAVRSVHSLAQGAPLAFTAVDEVVQVTAPTLNDHEVLVFEL